MPGEIGEGQPAPLNPQARADVDRSLANAGVKGDLNPKATEDVDRALKEGGVSTLDPLEPIKEDLVSNWEKVHGNRWDSNNLLRAEFQDFMFGDPTAPARGEVPVTLEERARVELRKRFPDEDQKIQEAEKSRVYDDPYADPAIRDAQSLITTRTNLDSEVVKAREAGGRSWNDAWYRTSNRIGFQSWSRFVDQYPEKAKAYQDKFPPIKAIFEGRERERRSREKSLIAVEGSKAGAAVIENSTNDNTVFFDELRTANPDYDYKGITDDMVTRGVEWAKSKGLDPRSLSPAQIFLSQGSSEVRNLAELADENKKRRLEVLTQNKDLLKQVLTSSGDIFAHATPSSETAQAILDSGLYCDSKLGLNGVAVALNKTPDQVTDKQQEQILEANIQKVVDTHQGYGFVVLVDLPALSENEKQAFEKRKAQGDNVSYSVRFAEKLGKPVTVNAVSYDAKLPVEYIKGYIDLDSGQFIPKKQK